MRLIRDAEQKRMPWKNGGGETIEVAISPDNASLETFDWRISRALIRRDGPFSPFPGIDRTIATIEGDGILMHIDDAAPVRLSPGDPPIAFAGEARVSSTMIGGEVMDLNVMTRRGRFRHRVQVIDADPRVDIVAPANGVAAVIVASNAVLHVGDANIALAPNDAALLTNADGAITAVRDNPGRIFLIEIESVGPSSML